MGTLPFVFTAEQTLLFSGNDKWFIFTLAKYSNTVECIQILEIQY